VRRSPGSLRNPAVSGDYFVVCPDEFYHAAELFASYREGNVVGIPNARVQTAKLSAVYDDYAFGIEEPGAIKRLLQAKRPAYVLLAVLGIGVFLAASTFGPAPEWSGTVADLQASGLPAYLVKRGDDLPAALSQPISGSGRKSGGVWMPRSAA